MYFFSLALNNFRNFQSEEIHFHPQFNLIIGKNAQGKTNLLEAVYYFGNLKSFRTSSRTDLIHQEQNNAILAGYFNQEHLHHEIRIHIEASKRLVSLNGKRPNLFKDYYGLVPILLFEPHDIYLFRGSPSLRRQFLSRALFLDSPSYLKVQRQYEEVLLQKNRLLKDRMGQVGPDELSVWNEQLAQSGATIIFRRLQWLEKMNNSLPKEYQNLAGGFEAMRLEYECSFCIPLIRNEKEIEVVLKNSLEMNMQEELRKRESIVGPHRDDWQAFLNERSIGVFGSQGENRSAVIAIKSAQVHLFEEEHGLPPLFLLDDVASELDESRTEYLFSYFRSTKGQVFMTTTEPTRWKNIFQEKGTSFVIEDGKIK